MKRRLCPTGVSSALPPDSSMRMHPHASWHPVLRSGDVFASRSYHDDRTAVVDILTPVPTVGPHDSGARALDLALADPSRPVPVVDADGRLLGVVAIDKQRAGFCGTDASPR